jgi:type I restriction enzyme S subunit
VGGGKKQSDGDGRTLGEVCEILDNLRKPVTKSDRDNGEFPYYGANGIQDYVDGYIFDGTFLLMGEDGSVINKDGSPVLNWATGKIWVNNHAHVLSAKDGYLLRYIFYVLQTKNVSSVVKGMPPKINQQNLRNIEIPIPPLPVQQKIVKVLDKFESLTTSISEGLPAEIEARHQQYEYYRNKLLTFRRCK